jgi:hypothetical protein
MQEALAANGDEAPEGSWDPVREPIPDAGELARSVEARMAAEQAGPDGAPGAAAGEATSERLAAPGAADLPDVPSTSKGDAEGA